MTPLTLDVRLDGFTEPVGTLWRKDNGRLSYQYRHNYRGIPLSLSLPISDEPIGDVVTRSFFDNLLQERTEPLESVMTREGIARDDIAGLLLHLGKDCSGAISVLPRGAPPAKVPGDFSKDYDHVSNERIVEIVRTLHLNNSFPDGMQDPSPLAGVQNKFAVTLRPDGSFAFPKRGSGAPTTHIIKIPNRNHPADAKQESTALALSKSIEIETAESELRAFDEVEALVVRRFDRGLNAEGFVVRLHQEDFAQALGLPRQLKYERNGNVGRRFDTKAIAYVLDQTAEPAISRLRFIQATLFDLLIGNVDAHAKNHALLYEAVGRPNLSPRYDLLPTRLDPQFTDELPYKIGNAKTLDDLRLEDFYSFLSQLGIATARGRQRIIQDTIANQTFELARRLEVLNGQKLFADLIASNIRRLCDIIGVDVPVPARNRDAFITHGGGWVVGS